VFSLSISSRSSRIRNVKFVEPNSDHTIAKNLAESVGDNNGKIELFWKGIGS
jgi:hypothetical protein